MGKLRKPKALKLPKEPNRDASAERLAAYGRTLADKKKAKQAEWDAYNKEMKAREKNRETVKKLKAEAKNIKK